MGNKANITKDTFPKQGSYLGRRTEVCFHYNTDATILGKVVRDDMEDPWVTIIALDDGRFVLATECQYSPAADLNPSAVDGDNSTAS